MANISITYDCNRSCEYCFVESENRSQRMAIDRFEQVLDFLDRSGIEQVRLLGGEPTLHPDFFEFVERALERKKNVLVFSNGCFSDEVSGFFDPIPSDRLSILVNSILPDEFLVSADEFRRQKKTFSRIPEKIMLGINIHRPGMNLKYLIDTIVQFGLQKSVRLGLALPLPGGSNTYLKARFYPEVGDNVSDFIGEALDEGIKIKFDCGFVPCMFSEEVLHRLGSASKHMENTCGPIIDILSNGSVVHCYPLAKVLDIEDALSATSEIHITELAKRADMMRPSGIFKECAMCVYRKERRCKGGCLSLAMLRMKRPVFELEVTDQDGSFFSSEKMK